MLQDPNSIMGLLTQYLRAIGWSVAAAVGFAFGIGIALKVFDMLSTDIDEWEEIKKGNMGVSLIFVSFNCYGWSTCLQSYLKDKK